MPSAKQTTTKAGTIVENGAQPALPTRCATIDASVAKSANKLVEDSSICWAQGGEFAHAVPPVTAPQSERDAVGDENSTQRADGDQSRGAQLLRFRELGPLRAVQAEQRQHGRDRTVGEDEDRERRAGRVVVATIRARRARVVEARVEASHETARL